MKSVFTTGYSSPRRKRGFRVTAATSPPIDSRFRAGLSGESKWVVILRPCSIGSFSAVGFRVEEKRPSPPFRGPSGGRGRGPGAKAPGRVRWATPLTASSAPLTLPSPPGQRGERVKGGLFGGTWGQERGLDFPRTALRFRGNDDKKQ
jgi:hypothetical protein